MAYKSKDSKAIINKIAKSTWYKTNQDFSLKIARGEVITTTKELRNVLVAKYSIDVDDAKNVSNDIMVHLSKECVKKPKDNDDGIEINVISATPHDKRFFNKLKFTTDKGNKVWMMRKNKENFEVSILESKVNDMSISYCALLAKQGLYSTYKSNYEHVCRTDPFALALIEDIVSRGKENQTTFTAPNFEEYMGKTLKIIGADETMFVPDLPISVSNNKDTPCFYYFDQDTLHSGEYGMWQQFMDRFPNEQFQKVFMEWLYMVFVEGVVCEQKMYIRGEGADGKSTIINILFKFMGHACYVVQAGSLKGNHWGAKVYDKRLVIHSDSKNPRPLDNEKSHLATDIIDVEKKYEAGFTHKANYMELFMSNDIPEINNVDNERRRMIYIPLSKLKDEQLKTFCKVDEDGNIIRDNKGNFILLGNTQYESELKDQFNAFLYACKEVYEENNNGLHNNVYIPEDVSTIMYDEIINDASEFEYVVSNLIHEDSEGHIKGHDLKVVYDLALSKEVKSYQAFTRQLKIKFPKIIKKSIRDKDGKQFKAWVGIKLDDTLADTLRETNADYLSNLRTNLGNKYNRTRNIRRNS